MDEPGALHRSVLLVEAIDALLTRPDGIYVDGTYGRGGHARALLARLAPAGRLVAFDRDPQAVASAMAGPAAIADARFSIHHEPYSRMAQVLAALGITQVDGVLLDVGVSSPQIDDPARGFSFRFDGPLDMRMDPTRGESAADFLAHADERRIAEVIRNYGEERFAVAIAKALVARRQGGDPVRTTLELSRLVAGAVKTREPGQDPATRTFQALRIHVNAELEELEQGLSAALRLLAPEGRLVVISFHSLEDRIVKAFIARESRRVVDRRSPDYWSGTPDAPVRLKALGRVKPSAAELRANPRARSAVMRVAERTAAPAGGAA
jgi:16S rRNA (cytosine1402-N4)-methyltransferase